MSEGRSLLQRGRTTFYALAIFAFVLLGFLLFLVLFEPGLQYKVKAPSLPMDSDPYLCLLGALSDAQVHRNSRIEVLTNGDVFYERELEAIRAATLSVNLEAYIFNKGEITRRFVEALAERARAGVKVNVVLDAIGSFAMRNGYFKDLTDAGGRLCWYQPIRWHTFKRFNNRTHRELIVIDGTLAFVGGAGIADFWHHDVDKDPQWRDTMFRVEGDMVIGLQTTFAENWLESSEEILTGEEYFPGCHPTSDGPVESGTSGIVVISAPSAGRATRARILFQTLLASAKQSIHITTPYFLPDRSARDEMIRAVKERGVKLRILTPGDHSDHVMTRRSSRRRYGVLLKAGAEIHEYQPSMIHAKVMVIDGTWNVVGTTNFDSRSFGLNDEVNVAACEQRLAARLDEDFNKDLAKSERITYEKWVRRPFHEKIVEALTWVLERQS